MELAVGNTAENIAGIDVELAVGNAVENAAGNTQKSLWNRLPKTIPEILWNWQQGLKLFLNNYYGRSSYQT